ncbi:MAG: helicase [Lentisphaerae bacterium RIFOXYC12_FULL_60_16]|nr:MAG: helicase [Lentisphaerae bacterium RIFOXYC12_FULL_60_16]
MHDSVDAPCIALSPQGHLLWLTTGGEPWPVASAMERVRDAFTVNPSCGLLHLSTREADTQLPAGPAFWRSFARLFLTRFCHRPETDDLQQVTICLSDTELQTLVDHAPPLPGAEYLSGEVLRGLWVMLDETVRAAATGCAGGAPEYLKQLGAVWRMVGRVCFHLAENRKRPDFPFAFLATYSAGLSAAGQALHRPLGQALKEYAGEGNQPALIALLTPVNRAAEASALVRELVETGTLFKPLAWRPDQAYRLLKDIPVLEASGLVVRLPERWGGKPPARPMVGVRVGETRQSVLGLDTLLDFKVETTLEGEALTPEEWRTLMESSGGLALIRGQWVEADPARLQATLDQWKQAEKAAADGLSFGDAMRLLSGLPHDPEPGRDHPAEETRVWTGIKPGAWLEQTLAALRDPSGLAVSGDNYGLKAVLRPYQRTGVEWLRFMSALGLGACLADDMGLGKTLQVLGVLASAGENRPQRPSLLVAPASLLANWRAELQRFAPSLRHRILHPSELAPEAWKAAQSDPELACKDCDMILTTYGMIARWDGLRRLKWNLAVLDEAQAIKNPAARQTKAVKELTAAHRIVLTGTPVENRLGDLWSLFDFLNPGLLGSARRFSAFVKESQADSTRLGALRSLVRPYILRRLKTDKRVITDLPDKTEIKAFCGLSKKQAALYEQAVNELARKIEETDGIQRRGLVLSFIMRFKQICNHPSQWMRDHAYGPDDSGKFRRLREIVSELAQRQEKALIFTQFQEMTDPLAAYLTELFRRPGLVLHGGTPVKERRRLVETFQAEDGPPFFVLSTKAGGTGLNLTAASHVIHFDRWWNPAVENQATDRAFRIGQKRNVLVHKFICRGTFEERIDQMIEDKTSLARDVVDGSGGAALLTEMNNRELMRFVSLDIERAGEAE